MKAEELLKKLRRIDKMRDGLYLGKCEGRNCPKINVDFLNKWAPKLYKLKILIINSAFEQAIKQERELLMWVYARSIGSDNITGLYVCDNYLEWERSLQYLSINNIVE